MSFMDRFKYPIFVPIWEQRRESTFIYFDYGKVWKNKDGTKCIRLKKRKINMPLENLDYVYNGVRPVLPVYSPRRDVFIPILMELPINNELAKLKIVDEEIDFWYKVEYERSNTWNKETWFQRHKALIEIGFLIALMGIVLIGGSIFLRASGEVLSDYAQPIISAVESIRGVNVPAPH